MFVSFAGEFVLKLVLGEIDATIRVNNVEADKSRSPCTHNNADLLEKKKLSSAIPTPLQFRTA